MKMTKTIKRQIEKIRISGVVNMLLTSGVQRAAFDRGYYELVNFIEDHRTAYVHYIFTGEELPDEDVAEDTPEEKAHYRVTIT